MKLASISDEVRVVARPGAGGAAIAFPAMALWSRGDLGLVGIHADSLSAARRRRNLAR